MPWDSVSINPSEYGNGTFSVRSPRTETVYDYDGYAREIVVGPPTVTFSANSTNLAGGQVLCSDNSYPRSEPEDPLEWLDRRVAETCRAAGLG